MIKSGNSFESITKNQNGHTAYSMQDKDRLVTQVLTSFFGELKYYGDNASAIVETASRIAENEPEFIAKLAVFARNEFNMRSVSHVLSAILAHEPKGKPLTRKTVANIAVRADDMMEILAIYLELYGKPIPNSLKKGISDAFIRFDEYALAKYKGVKYNLKMRDVLRVCHPTPKSSEQSELWKSLITGRISTPVTWETELSANGNNAETWGKLIDSGKVGYMGLLRNLRNIIKANPTNITKVYDTLTDSEQVRKSRQLPFRFLSAYKELQAMGGVPSIVFDVLEKAVDISIENMPTLSGKTAIVVDVSGSMCDPVSSRSKLTCAEIGLLLGVMASRICDECLFLTFDTKLHLHTILPNSSVLAQMRKIRVKGGATNMSLPFEYLIENKIIVDRIIVLSDNAVNTGRSWDSGNPVQSLADKYRLAVYDCWVHGVDLQGYGTQQFLGEKTNIIAGWSEKLLDFIRLAEEGILTMVKNIERYEL